MTVIYFLIPLSIVFASVFLAGFIWAVRSGQYEDTCTPSLRPLMDDQLPAQPRADNKNSQENNKTNPK